VKALCCYCLCYFCGVSLWPIIFGDVAQGTAVSLSLYILSKLLRQDLDHGPANAPACFQLCIHFFFSLGKLLRCNEGGCIKERHCLLD